LVADPTTLVTKGSTFENAGNLAGSALRQLLKKYGGTRLGLQELEAHILEDTPGALWTRSILDEFRVQREIVPDLVRVVVGVDPAATATKDSDETGIVAVGIDRFKHIYVLDDYSMKGRPQAWAKRAVALYDIHKGDRIVAEVNNGGDMVETTIRSVNKKVSFKQVRATKGKYTRAEPVSALYEQGLVHHVGALGELEDQMCTWLPGDASPDRIDALVWAISELALKNKGKTASAKAKVTGMYASRNRSKNKWEKAKR
jgi:phage terminase large subunit-like protein